MTMITGLLANVVSLSLFSHSSLYVSVRVIRRGSVAAAAAAAAAAAVAAATAAAVCVCSGNANSGGGGNRVQWPLPLLQCPAICRMGSCTTAAGPTTLKSCIFFRLDSVTFKSSTLQISNRKNVFLGLLRIVHSRRHRHLREREEEGRKEGTQPRVKYVNGPSLPLSFPAPLSHSVCYLLLIAMTHA